MSFAAKIKINNKTPMIPESVSSSEISGRFSNVKISNHRLLQTWAFSDRMFVFQKRGQNFLFPFWRWSMTD